MVAANTDAASGSTPGEWAAGSGDDVIELAEGIYVLGGSSLTVSSGIRIDGDPDDDGRLAAIDADGASSVLTTTGAASLEVDHVTVTGGNGGMLGGRIRADGGSLAVTGVGARHAGAVNRLADAVARDLDVEVVAAGRLGGGDVAESFRMQLADGSSVFAKTHRNPPPGFFTTEAGGLRWLREPGVLPVPDVLAVSDGDDSSPPRLVLEWIDEGGRGSADGEAALGRALARLHRAGAPSFGREDRRTTGSRALPNDPCDTWVEFYGERRLGVLLRMARDQHALPASALAKLEWVIGQLCEVGGPAEPPARLHGDLWAGNRLVDRIGRSWLIDPAFHGGHREFDLAMMRLFGGFGNECFDAYAAEWPLADGWEVRVPLHQLAPLTVHAIKFGGGYAAATERALDVVLAT